MPLTPSHVEVLSSDGKQYLGSHLEGGVQPREVGYDLGQFSDERLIPLTTSDEQSAAVQAFMLAHIGEAYDWEAIFGFLLPEHFHLPNHVICSALVTLALRNCGWFQWPVAAPAHLVSPRDLLLMVSAKQEVKGI